MEDKTHIQLTAAEMSSLWTQYLNDTLAVCVNTYFLEKVEDQEIRPVIEWTLNTAKENISIMRDIFEKEKFPIPMGFTDQDVNSKAPRLFSDTFVLIYLRNMSYIAMASNSAAIGLATRADVVNFHKRVLNAGVVLQDKTRDLMLKQGTYIRPPTISTPDKVGFVDDQQFLAGFFGKKRALTSVEVTHLFLNIQTNAIGKVLMMGFAQTSKNEDVKQFLTRGKRIAQKHIEIFNKFLTNEDLPAPMGWDTAVSDCTTNIFSDKLIMFHVSAMIAVGIGNYGIAMAASPRRDLGLKYASLIPEISLYAEDAANIMIKRGWMEEPPQTDDRDGLVKGQ
ncbi:DUF3231 family protein [Bacillus sp. DTU_2020_1000418_1_SI_GHA_SEK_038]|uniref:DUF3231 family protein n=1 Tax=Bacillus sp. DTU_2020_1000418_1_SI_GHA_SEK_038 TaxID=3077585 RepID=UPI0028EF01A6|nr:DUF3231 family protein [Bacillus sp. DTU_2020_1000418_1_SI_GHA_SEK_038]WNS76664.1 DUF3231 family protein [Bacillus sp. DTU_2020_1000418_1_SI_GHA_SEK_038]